MLRKAWCGLFPGEKPRVFDDFMHEFGVGKKEQKAPVKVSELPEDEKAERIRQQKLAWGVTQQELDGLPPIEKPRIQTRKPPVKRKSV